MKKLLSMVVALGLFAAPVVFANNSTSVENPFSYEDWIKQIKVMCISEAEKSYLIGVAQANIDQQNGKITSNELKARLNDLGKKFDRDQKKCNATGRGYWFFGF
ncbi:MAG: hypothetical protein Nk1A_7320 [Endomicrobiia bacterium]|nr:MAG: hypothetical protein Nk1A_7320 [Endomicrobiia bacterium]